MQKATYHVHHQVHGVYDVVKLEGGLADLAREDGSLVVTSCPVSDEPKSGHCTLLEVKEQEQDPEAQDPPKPKAKAAKVPKA